MKKMKKLVSVMLTLAMVLAMAITTFAADATTYSITAPDNGHTYEVYQIFTGDLSGTTLSNIAAGKNYNGSDAATDAKTLGEATEGMTSDSDKLAEIKKYVTLSDPYKTVAAGATATGIPAGYYLIKDVNGSQADKDDSYTLYLAKIVGDTTIKPKTDTPTVEKKVYDESKGFQDGSDYDIGDSIPYKLTATLGDTSAYDAYYVQFDDTFCNGLKYDTGSVNVYVVAKDDVSKITATSKAEDIAKIGTDVTSQFDIDAPTSEGGKLVVTCDDVKALKDGSSTIALEDGTQIIVTYTATLTTDAILTAGNFNEVQLTYSNNPNTATDKNTADDETGKTTTDKVGVFTYKVEITKKDDAGNNLKGADFTLYQKAADGSYVAVNTDLKSEVTADTVKFSWTGIDAGDYKLVETQTPAGYNTADDLYFSVKATYDYTETGLSDEATRSTLTVTDKDGANLTEGDDATFTATMATGTVAGDFVNEKGATLPTTGGMGTTLFYLFGGILVVGAGIILVSRKRMAK